MSSTTIVGWYDSPIRHRLQSTALRTITGLEQLAFRPVLPVERIRNFLLLEHSLALGTAIHGTPLISVLKAVLPDARIVAAASGFGLGVLRGNPGLDRLIGTPSPINDLRAAVKALREVQPVFAEPFAVLHTTGNLRTRPLLLAMLGGGHTRVGFSVHPELTQRPLAFDGTASQIANNLRIVEALGHGTAMRRVLTERPEVAEPVVFPEAADFDHVRGLLAEGALDPSRPLAVFVTQTSATQRKGWRAERFRATAGMLAREFGAGIVFGGTAAEAPAIEALRDGLAVPSVNLAGRTTLLQMAALFGQADIALTLDTGPMHLGRAMGTPMVVIAPAWSPPVEWLPVDNPRARILKNLTLDTAPEDYIIDEVSVAEVESALRDLLRTYPPHTQRRRGA